MRLPPLHMIRQRRLWNQAMFFTLGAHLPFNVAVATNTTDDYYAQAPVEL